MPEQKHENTVDILIYKQHSLSIAYNLSALAGISIYVHVPGPYLGNSIWSIMLRMKEVLLHS